MRSAIVVISCLFLVLLAAHHLAEYVIILSDDAASYIDLGKDAIGLVLGVLVLLFMLARRDKAGPAT